MGPRENSWSQVASFKMFFKGVNTSRFCEHGHHWGEFHTYSICKSMKVFLFSWCSGTMDTQRCEESTFRCAKIPALEKKTRKVITYKDLKLVLEYSIYSMGFNLPLSHTCNLLYSKITWTMALIPAGHKNAFKSTEMPTNTSHVRSTGKTKMYCHCSKELYLKDKCMQYWG